MGTPTEERWPGWSKLPNVGVMKFQKTPHNNLRAHLYQTCVKKGGREGEAGSSGPWTNPHTSQHQHSISGNGIQNKQAPVHLLLRLL